MFSRRRFWLMLFGTAAIAGTGWLLYSLYCRVKPLTPDTEARLAEIIVPKFNLDGVELEKALAVLEAACSAKGVRFQVWQEAKLPVELRASRLQARATSFVEELRFSDIPASEALRYLATATRLPVAERAGTILVFPEWQGEFVKLQTRTFPVQKGSLRSSDAEGHLRAAGISFSGGGSAWIVGGGTRVRVRATVQELDMCDALFNSGSRLDYAWRERMWHWVDAGANLLQ